MPHKGNRGGKVRCEIFPTSRHLQREVGEKGVGKLVYDCSVFTNNTGPVKHKTKAWALAPTQLASEASKSSVQHASMRGKSFKYMVPTAFQESTFCSSTSRNQDSHIPQNGVTHSLLWLSWK